MVYDIKIEGGRMEQVHECIYLGCLVSDRGTEKFDCEKVINGRRVAGTIRALVNEKRESWVSQVLHKSLIPMMYRNETLVSKERE